ncbi:mutS protein homolog 5-like isoform X2 [Tachypleus tridentatus]
MPSIDFSYEAAKRRLNFINLPFMPPNLTDDERHIFLSSLLDFTNVSMVRATGGLLKFLEKNRIGIQLESENSRIPVLGLSSFTLEKILWMDENTYSALQVFYEEWHPSVYKSSSGRKEGLSLYGILNRCKTYQGSKELRNMLLRPTQNLEILTQRQEAVGFFLATENMETTTTIQDCLKHIKNIPRILAHMAGAHATVNDWKTLYKSVYNAMLIGDLCSTLPQRIFIINKITTTFTSDLCRVANLIYKIVDFEESVNQDHFVVKPGVDEELDQKKRTYNGLPDFMTKVAQQELSQLSDGIKECQVIYLPQLGYLLAVPLTDEMLASSNYELPGLEFVFMSNNVAHYKTANTRELDNLLGDTQCEIRDHETQIMHRLQNIILEVSNVFTDVVTYSAQLDVLISLAVVAKEFNYIKPELTNENIVCIKGGRHPLQELCVTTFVPNDTYTGLSGGKMVIVTGPNASGKSVYLKQVALIVFMAHIGSSVPADSAKIGVTDHIFSRMHTRESVSLGLSTFMIDVNQMAHALRKATSRTLVIIDEFGKGTEIVDGLALLTCSLKFWLKKEQACPHVLVSTHFHSIFNLLRPSALLKYQTMDVLREEDDFVFLYQLKDGRADGSFAHHVASLAGIPTNLIERGKQVSELFRQNRPIPPINQEVADAKLKTCAAVVSDFLHLDLDSADLQAFLQHVLKTMDNDGEEPT